MSFQIQTQSITKIYPHPVMPVIALHELNFQVAKGEFCAIVGASGSGKSTFLKILGGLLQPTTGKVWVGKQEITQLSDTQLTLFRRQAMGFVFQEYNLLPVLTSIENVAFGLRLQNLPAREATEKAHFWLERVGLSGKEKVLPAQLSGGQQQRVAIARALAMQPQVIIADEPTSSLDSQNALQIAELLKNLQKNTQTTLVLATHDSRLLPFADRIVEIEDGRLL
jgi:putative ABC transport system ATP-binding protein